MFFFSKSRYCQVWQCPKNLWLNKYRPELKPVDASLQARFDTGNVIGDMAMELFGEFTEVTAFKPDGSLDLNKMQELTKQCIKDGVENICEASFNYNGLYCAVDILRLPSNANGFVTIPTVRMPCSFAISAMIGAEPVPVPPPIPAVINTI